MEIYDEFIPLGQFLKFVNITSSGGIAKAFLDQYEVYVNGELEKRRGRKLYPGDVIEIPDFGSYIVSKDEIGE